MPTFSSFRVPFSNVCDDVMNLIPLKNNSVDYVLLHLNPLYILLCLAFVFLQLYDGVPAALRSSVSLVSDHLIIVRIFFVVLATFEYH